MVVRSKDEEPWHRRLRSSIRLNGGDTVIDGLPALEGGNRKDKYDRLIAHFFQRARAYDPAPLIAHVSSSPRLRAKDKARGRTLDRVHRRVARESGIDAGEKPISCLIPFSRRSLGTWCESRSLTFQTSKQKSRNLQATALSVVQRCVHASTPRLEPLFFRSLSSMNRHCRPKHAALGAMQPTLMTIRAAIVPSPQRKVLGPVSLAAWRGDASAE